MPAKHDQSLNACTHGAAGARLELDLSTRGEVQVSGRSGFDAVGRGVAADEADVHVRGVALGVVQGGHDVGELGIGGAQAHAGAAHSHERRAQADNLIPRHPFILRRLHTEASEPYVPAQCLRISS